MMMVATWLLLILAVLVVVLVVFCDLVSLLLLLLLLLMKIELISECFLGFHAQQLQIAKRFLPVKQMVPFNYGEKIGEQSSKPRHDIPLYFLVYRDPYIGLLWLIIPIYLDYPYQTRNPGFEHCSGGLVWGG